MAFLAIWKICYEDFVRRPWVGYSQMAGKLIKHLVSMFIFFAKNLGIVIIAV